MGEKSAITMPIAKRNNSGSIFAPIYTYICACLLITLIQMAIVYFRFGNIPNMSSMSCNIICLIVCSLIIYTLTNFGLGPAWGCAILLILFMFACCMSATMGSNMAKYGDASLVIGHITGSSAIVPTAETQVVTMAPPLITSASATSAGSESVQKSGN